MVTSRLVALALIGQKKQMLWLFTTEMDTAVNTQYLFVIGNIGAHDAVFAVYARHWISTFDFWHVTNHDAQFTYNKKKEPE